MTHAESETSGNVTDRGTSGVCFFDLTSTQGQPFLTGIQRIVRKLVFLNDSFVPIAIGSGKAYEKIHLGESLLAKPALNRFSVARIFLSFSSRFARNWFKILDLVTPASRRILEEKLAPILKRIRSLLLNTLIENKTEKSNVDFRADKFLLSEVPTSHQQLEVIEDLLKDGKIRLIVLLHDLIPLEDFGVVRPDASGVFVRFAQLVALADKVVCISEDVYSRYMGWRQVVRNVNENQTIATMEFPYLPEWMPEVLEKPKSEHATPYFFSLGSLTKRKNIFLVIEALEVVLNSGYQAKLVVCGSGSYELDPRIKEKLLKNKNLARNFEFHPDLSDEEIIRYLASSAAFVFPSCSEGFGLPLIEAASLNKIILCSDISPVGEIGKKIGAICLPPNSSAAWSDAMTEVLNGQISAKSKLPKETSSWEIWAKRLIEL